MQQPTVFVSNVCYLIKILQLFTSCFIYTPFVTLDMVAMNIWISRFAEDIKLQTHCNIAGPWVSCEFQLNKAVLMYI